MDHDYVTALGTTGKPSAKGVRRCLIDSSGVAYGRQV